MIHNLVYDVFNTKFRVGRKGTEERRGVMNKLKGTESLPQNKPFKAYIFVT